MLFCLLRAANLLEPWQNYYVGMAMHQCQLKMMLDSVDKLVSSDWLRKIKSPSPDGNLLERRQCHNEDVNEVWQVDNSDWYQEKVLQLYRLKFPSFPKTHLLKRELRKMVFTWSIKNNFAFFGIKISCRRLFSKKLIKMKSTTSVNVVLMLPLESKRC